MTHFSALIQLSEITLLGRSSGHVWSLEPFSSLWSGFYILHQTISDCDAIDIHTMSSMDTMLTEVSIVCGYNLSICGYKEVQIFGTALAGVWWCSLPDCSVNLVYESCDKLYSSFSLCLRGWNTDGRSSLNADCVCATSCWWNSWLKWNLKVKTTKRISK